MWTTMIAQDCGCDHFISMDFDYVDGSDFLPGDVVCIESGIRAPIRFENVNGTMENPVLIKNCGGNVTINALYGAFGIDFVASSHFILSGAPEEEGGDYGFSILNGVDYGLKLSALSNYFKIEYLSIDGTEGPAIYSRNEPQCDLTANDGYFYLEDCSFENIQITDCSEGIKIGHPAYHLGVVDSDCGAIFPHAVKNLNLKNLRIEEVVAGNGIEIYGATAKIENCKLNSIFGHGILIGTKSAVDIMRNEISNTYMNGVRAEGSGQHKMYNNVFYNNSGVGMGAVYLACFAAAGDTDENSIYFVHNTAINSGTYHLTIANPVGITGASEVKNNLFANSVAPLPYLGDFSAWLNIESHPLIEVTNNAYAPDATAFDFVNPDAADFRLTHTSDVINEGLPSTVEVDKSNELRDLAGAPDLGAYEYVPEPIAYFEEIPLVGLYVDDFKNILGNEEQETQLLEFAKDSGFNYLLFYNLDYIHTNIGHLDDPLESLVLSNFIERAKKEYGIAQVGAVGETDASFNKVQDFNGLQNGNWYRMFDVLNMEFEFWTDNDALLDYYCDNYLDGIGLPCTNADAYTYYEDQLELIDARADEMGIISEIYIGYTSDDQSIALAERCDRMLLHHYRATDTYGDGTSIYNYHTYRIRAIALSDRKPAVMPIFSSRSYHMGPWLADHSLHQPMETWLYGLEGYYEDDAEGVHDLPISGFQWYRYTSFLDIMDDVVMPVMPAVPSAAPAIFVQTTTKASVTVLSIDARAYEVQDELRLELYDLQGQFLGRFNLAENSVVQKSLTALSSTVCIGLVWDGDRLVQKEKLVIN